MESRVIKISVLDFSAPQMKMRLQKNVLTGFKEFIEHSDWDVRILSCQKWVDGFCWGFVGVSLALFLPMMVHILP